MSIFYAVSQLHSKTTNSNPPLTIFRPTKEQIKKGLVNELLNPSTNDGMKLLPKPSTWNKTNNPVYNVLAAKRQVETRAAAAAADRGTNNLKRKRQAPKDDRRSTSKKPSKKRRQSDGRSRDDATEVDSSDDDTGSTAPKSRRQPPPPPPPKPQPATSSTTSGRNWRPSLDKKPQFDHKTYYIPPRVPMHHSSGAYIFNTGSPFYGMHRPFCYHQEDDKLSHASKDSNKTTPLYSVGVQVGYVNVTLDRQQRECIVYGRYSVAAAFMLHLELRDRRGYAHAVADKRRCRKVATFGQVVLTGHFRGAFEDVVRWIVWHLQPMNWQMAVAERCGFQYRASKDYSG